MNFQIGYPISNKNPRNTWRLSMEFMHGDADAYSTEKFDFDENFMRPHYGQDWGDLPTHVTVIRELSWLDRHDEWDTLASQIPNYDKTFEGEWPTDSTCDDYYADLQSWRLTYFDENGVEHEVDVVW